MTPISPTSRLLRHAAFCGLLSCSLLAHASDWNQWRGPNRNGVLTAGPKLADVWSTDGPPKLWESVEIPANDNGGHGSAVIANGRVYLSVVWHSAVPSVERVVDDLVMRKLGHQRLNGLSAELIAKLEEARMNLNRRLRGNLLDEFANNWIKENLDKKQALLQGDYIKGRLKKGPAAIPFADYGKLESVKDKPFPNHAAFLAWVEQQGFSDAVKAEVLKAVPPTRRVARDSVVCLDLKTGQTLWKTEAPGLPKGRNCSSTPVVAAGKVFAVGSTAVYCVDPANGKLLWSSPFKNAGLSSSPMVLGDLLIIHLGELTALDLHTGKEKWRNTGARMGSSSPSFWRHGEHSFVIANTRSHLVAIDANTGRTQWQVECGGDSTPAVLGDLLAVQSRSEKIGLMVVRLDVKEPKTLWTFPFEARRTQASPIIADGIVYLIDDQKAYAFEAVSGKKLTEQPVLAAITSPVVADNKFYVITDRGNNLTMFKPEKGGLTELGKTRIKALWCPSPSVSEGRIVVRTENRLVCYDVSETGVRGN